MPHDIRNCYVVRKARGTSNIVGSTHGWELTTGIRRSKRTATLSVSDSVSQSQTVYCRCWAIIRIVNLTIRRAHGLSHLMSQRMLYNTMHLPFIF